MTRKITKFALISTLIWIIIFVVGTAVTIKNVNNKGRIAPVGNISKSNIDSEPKTKNTTLIFVGDIMLTRGVKSSVDNNFGGDYSKLFFNLEELKNKDILFGNLEGDVSDVGNNVGSIYSFRMDPKVLQVLKDAGFDIVGFANNHVGDWNMAAFKNTLTRLTNIGILKSGAGSNYEEAKNPTIIEKNGIKFGFLSFTDVGPDWIAAKTDTPGVLLASDPNFENIIKNAKTKCDVLITTFHWGVEYKTTHNVHQQALAHNAIDSGADMVIGGHPHVMQDIETYKNKKIVYSLGNFIFDQYFSEETMRGMVFTATFQGTNLISTDQKIITLNKNFQPEGLFKPEDVKKIVKTITPVCPKPIITYDDMTYANIGQITGLLDATYIPKNLAELSTTLGTRKGLCLTNSTIDAFKDLVGAAKKDGLTIKASSAFRSYDTQQTLYSAALKSSGTATSISTAKPGYSEHQLGTTMDLTGSSNNYSSAADSFGGTPEDEWLLKNAYLYGFIQSYPEGKESVTGYKYEPWHYRYVGVKKAKEVYDSGLTLTEFL